METNSNRPRRTKKIAIKLKKNTQGIYIPVTKSKKAQKKSAIQKIINKQQQKERMTSKSTTNSTIIQNTYNNGKVYVFQAQRQYYYTRNRKKVGKKAAKNYIQAKELNKRTKCYRKGKSKQIVINLI